MQDIKQKLLETTVFYECPYLDSYVELIESNLKQKKTRYQTQLHHIVPRCYYSYNNIECNNGADNLVNLLFRDHLVAHYLLFHCCNDGNLRHALASAFLLLRNVASKDISIEGIDLDNVQLMFEEYLKTRSTRYTGREGYNKGRKIINNGVNEKLVFPEDLEEYLQDGWFLGRLPFSEENIQKKSESQKGRRVMFKGDVTVHVKSCDIDKFIEDGYCFGQSARTKEQARNTAAANNKPREKYVVVFNGCEYKNIRLSELDTYLSNGYIKKGRPRPDELRVIVGLKNKINNTGRVHVHNDTQHFMIMPDELDGYLARGFVMGSGVSTKHSSTIWMNKEGKNTRVSSDRVSEYEACGWVHGVLKGKKRRQ